MSRCTYNASFVRTHRTFSLPSSCNLIAFEAVLKSRLASFHVSEISVWTWVLNFVGVKWTLGKLKKEDLLKFVTYSEDVLVIVKIVFRECNMTWAVLRINYLPLASSCWLSSLGFSLSWWGRLFIDQDASLSFFTFVILLSFFGLIFLRHFTPVFIRKGEAIVALWTRLLVQLLLNAWIRFCKQKTLRVIKLRSISLF